MKPRAHLPQRERSARSRLAKLLHEQEIIAGSLVTTRQTCGKPNCRCKRGEKHTAVYLAFKYKGKRRMYSVPQSLRPQVHQAVENYKQIRPLLEVLSAHCYERIMQHKES